MIFKVPSNPYHSMIKRGTLLTKGNSAWIAVSEIQKSSTIYCINQVGSDGQMSK